MTLQPTLTPPVAHTTPSTIPQTLSHLSYLIKKNIVVLMTASLGLSLILNLQLLDFSIVNPDDGSQLQAIDVKLPKAPVGAEEGKWNIDSSQDTSMLDDKQQQQEQQEQPGLNLTEFQITKDSELEYSSIYTSLLQSHPASYLTTLNQQEKCQLYFSEVYKTFPETKIGSNQWQVEDFDSWGYNRGAWDHKDEEIKEDESKEEKAKKENSIKVHQAMKLHNQRIERRHIDTLTHLKAYDTCFLNADDDTRRFMTERFDVMDLEKRLFPWFGFKLPTFTRWNGQVLKGRVPLMGNFTKDQFDSHLLPFDGDHNDDDLLGSSFMAKLRKSFNGKGFVVSASDKQADQMFQLIALLRAIGNKLPIQVFHYGDLSRKNIERMIQIARSDKELKIEGNVDNLSHILKAKRINLQDIHNADERSMERLFPKQEVWFVNAEGTIRSKYRHYFNGFGNKLIAYFFNSFKEMMLIDTDTIPVVDLDYNVLQSSEFVNKGAYFFRDREINVKLSKGDVKYISKLLPSQLDAFFLDTPQSTNHTLSNRILESDNVHLQESGVVAVDKSRHFTSILTTMQLIQFTALMEKVYGDKELFWLGFSITGDESYYFNKWHAGALGSTVTPLKNRIFKDDSKKRFYFDNEVCSTHPGHLSGIDDSTLLWFNSGFTRCKVYDGVNNNDMSSRLNPKKFKSSFELKSFYAGYQNFEYLLVPGTSNLTGQGDYFATWWKMNECNGYIWCAYNNKTGHSVFEADGYSIANHTDTAMLTSIAGEVEYNEADGPQRNEQEVNNGVLVGFGQEQKKYFNYLGSIYDNALRIYGLEFV